jgi:hypothetical protein
MPGILVELSYLIMQIINNNSFSFVILSIDLSSLNSPNIHRQSYGEFSTKIRQIFRRTPQSKTFGLSKAVSNLQEILQQSNETTDIFSSPKSNDAKHEICLVSDSPHYIVRVGLIYMSFIHYQDVYLRLLELEILKNLKNLFLVIYQN